MTSGARRLARHVLTALVVLAALARFARLEADFPWELTSSGAPYTDEGWYSNAAVNHEVRGDWYLPGDVNEAVVQPTFHLVQTLNFRLFGMSLATARVPGAVMFCGLVVVVFGLLRSQLGPSAGAVAALLLSTHFHLFAYSRIALVDLPMLFFVVVAARLLFIELDRLELVPPVAAGLSYAAAVLTKGSAYFALPALAALAWLGARDGRARTRRMLGFFLGLGLPMALHHVWATHGYQIDLEAYRAGLASQRVELSVAAIAHNTLAAVRELMRTDRWLFLAVAISSFVALKDRKELFGLKSGVHRLVAFLFAGYFLWVGALGISTYHPTRYMLPGIVFSIAIVSVATWRLLKTRSKVLTGALLLYVLVSASLNGFRMVSYLAGAGSSYSELCRTLASELEGEGQKPFLAGEIAPQITLATGIPSISGRTGARDLAWRVERYSPTHFLSRGPVAPDVLEVLEKSHTLVVEGRFDVFGNYYNGPVYLYRMVEP